MRIKTLERIRMTRFVLVLSGLAALLCMSAAPADKAAADKEKIQGTWKFISILDQGTEQQVPEENRLVITADVMKIVYPKDAPMGWKYTIDPSKDPRQMDWFTEIDPGRPIHQPGIYSLDGDTLKICSTAAGKPRPTRFESKRGDFGGLWVLKRVPPPSAKEAAK
jgi:uncharacterized protein (TIGR03067 family)